MAEPSKETMLKNVIEDFRIDERYQDVGRIEELQNVFKSSPEAKSKKLSAIALGAHFAKSNPKLAIQYLSTAKLLDEKEPAFAHIIDYYSALSYLNIGNTKKSYEISKQLLASRISRSWKEKATQIYVESAFQAKKYSDVFEEYRKYESKKTLNAREEEILKYVALAFEKSNKWEQSYQIYESLSGNYPMTSISRWAFRKLLDGTCKTKKNPYPFVFSKKLLVRLSRNTNLDTGVSDFVKQAIEGEIRLSKNTIRHLTSVEKLQTLFTMRFYEDALTLGLDLIKDRTYIDNTSDHQYLLLTITRIYLRLNDPVHASRYASIFMEKYPKSYSIYRAQSYLGDALAILGYSKQASGLYKDAAKLKARRSDRWGEFWQLYKEGDYEGALALLNRPNYVKPLDVKYRDTLPFWKAKILIKLGRAEQAKGIYKNILKENANGYYAQMVAARYPSLIQESKGNTADEKEKDIYSFAAKSLDSHQGSNSSIQIPELLPVEDLIKVGLQEPAQLELEAISWRKYNEVQSFASIAKLALMINNYESSHNLKYRKFSALRKKPDNWWQLEKHQSAHNSEWRVYFPLAFDDIVDRVAKNVDFDKYFILSIMRAESRYETEAKSWVGARGLMQIMPYTGLKLARLLNDSEFTVEQLAQPKVNISYGGYYLKYLNDYYSGNIFLTAAAYNAGPIAVNKWIERCNDCTIEEFVETISYRETRQYVKKVLTYYAFYQRIYESKSSLRGLPEIPKKLPAGVEIF